MFCDHRLKTSSSRKYFYILHTTHLRNYNFVPKSMRTIPVEELKEAPSQMLPKNRVLKSHDYEIDFQINFIHYKRIDSFACPYKSCKIL